jgi:A/G-specific adenine glycosylase
MPSRANPSEHCERHFGAVLARARKLPKVRHGFTHFTLNIAPVLCDVRRLDSRAGEPGRLWLPAADAAQAAVPAPVRKLLREMNAG